MSNQTHLLSIRNLSKSFGGLQIIRDLSFDVSAASSVALIGPNGAGKTTVFNLISGVYDLTSGSMEFNGRDITPLPSNKRIQVGIARSFQNIRLMQHLTVLDNLLVGQHVRASGLLNLLQPFRIVRKHRWVDEILEELEAVDLKSFAYERISTLPYGIRKRIDLVRATLARSSLLMLDEPAAGLNASETAELHAHLNMLKKRGVALLVIEHDMHFVASICEKIVVINFGEKIAEGSFNDVKAQPKVREAYLGSEQIS